MNLGILRSITRGSQIVSKSFESCKYHTTISVLLSPSKPSPDDKESDPFGLNDDKDLTNLLIQGNLAIKEESPRESVDAKSRLKKYEEWVKYSQDRNSNNENAETENFRASNSGNIRLDRDNAPVEVESEIEYRKDRQLAQLDFKERKPIRSAFVPPEEKEGGPNRRMTAYEFVKSRKLEQKEIKNSTSSRRNAEQSNAYPEYEDTGEDSRIEHPEDYTFKEEFNELPKQYKLVDLNTLTHGDMWSVLKNSIIFENKYVLAINKPFGIPFQGKSRDCHHNIMQFVKEFAEYCKCPEIFPVHRIDKDTTGALLFAKDKRVANVISQKFANRQIRKRYLTITKNCPPIPKGTVKIPIGEGKIGGTTEFRSVLKPDLHDYNINSSQRNSREAITKFNVINSTHEYAFVEVEPESGVKHQIRVHLGLGLSCPVLGDHKYSHRDKLAPQRLPSIILRKLKLKQSKVRELPIHLHCSQIAFDLSSEFTDSTEPLFIQAKVPYFFNHSLKALGLIRSKK